METEGLDFGAALESLAERYNVQLERETEDPREAERRERRERLYALLERTAAYYVRVLWESPEAAFAREYLEQRGLREDALRAYRVGYAPDAYDRVLLGSQRAGYSTDELLAAGLIQPSRGRAGYIDRFRGRVTFPLTDVKGHVLGFGARAMKPDQQPKYLNTSDGEIFHKSQVVYGQDMARAAAARAGRVVLVEGYTDVIALHQAGVPETVAQMGTALTDAQINAMAKLAPKALFCQDPDRAGQESVARGIAALRGVNVRQAHDARRRVPDRPAALQAGPGGRRPARGRGRDARAARQGAWRSSASRSSGRSSSRTPSRDDMLADDDAADRLAAGERAARGSDPARRQPARASRPEVVMEVRARRERGAAARRVPALERGRAPVERRPARRQAVARRRTRSLPATGAAAGAGRPARGARPPRAQRGGLPLLLHRDARARASARLADVDIDDYFSSPATRKAAAHIRGRLRSPERQPARRATRTSRASWPSSRSRRTGSRRRPRSSSSRRSSSTCTGSSATSPRPACPATRAASARSRPSAEACSTRSGIGSPEQHFSVRHTN